MTVLVAAKTARCYYGLSTDTKPVAGDLPAERLGSTFDEIDTGRRFIWNGSAWVRRMHDPALPPPMYFFMLPSQVHVAVANTVHWDFFNAHASLVVRLRTVLQIPNITTAVTGVVFDWLFERTTSVGTGGSALTAWLPDSAQAALDAAITARSKPTGGAAQSTDLRNYSISSEETDAGTIQTAVRGGFEVLPPPLLPINGGNGFVLRPNEGVRCVQITNSAAGNSGWLIGFSVE